MMNLLQTVRYSDYLSLAARRHVTVALSADGDEVFAGYNRYDYIQRYIERLNKIPSFFRKSIVQTMEFIPSNVIPYFRNTYNFHNRYEKIKGMADPTREQIMMSLSEQFTDAQIRKIARFDYEKLSTAYASKELKGVCFHCLFDGCDYQTYLVDDILQR